MDRRLLPGLLVSAILASATVGPAIAQSVVKPDSTKTRDAKKEERDKARRLDKLDKNDRAAIDNAIGFVAPEFTSSVDWVTDEGAPSLKSLRGKVVVIQTFTTKNTASRTTPERLAKALAEFKSDDVQLIVIHTPEGADKADVQLGKSKPEMPTGIDRTGDFCDLIGAYKKPINVVIDRTGDIKAGGLTIDGVAETVKELVAAPYDPANLPTARPKETSVAKKEFPTFNTPISGAADLRGKTSPPLPRNVEWLTNAPSPQGKLVIVDFWATWCPPCRAAIPHMNEIAKGFSRDVACIGISDETGSKFDSGLRQYGLTRASFEYSVGTDPMGSMKKGFGVSDIPHVAVISTDGVVRWQGHPGSLTPELVTQLVEANRSMISTGGGAAGPSDRWQRDTEAQKDRASAKGREKDKKKSY
ncbi:MAG: TlpA family protein disulfide reductase [Phycisphaerae bacterium]|nr:TlpA family protein disulfide reductase [Phycisphaerae bacterium]